MSVAFVGAAATVVGSAISASSASKAAKGQQEATNAATAAQAEAAKQQLALQREQYETALRLSQPGIQAGNLARNSLLYQMGLTPYGTSQPATLQQPGTNTGAATGTAPTGQQASTVNRDAIRQQLQSQYTQSTQGQQGGTIPTYQERPDLYTASGYAGEGGVQPTYIGPQGGSTTTTNTQGLDAAVEAEYQRQMARQNEVATQEQANLDAERAAALQQSQNDPGYGQLNRNFGAADLAQDNLYESDLVNQARARASNVNNDPFYERGLVDAARSRASSVDNDPFYQQALPAIQAAAAQSVSVNDDPLYQQLNPLLQSAISRASNFETSPGYAFRQAEGQKGVENSAAARGGLYSGAALKAIDRFNQDYASNEYGNWVNQSAQDRAFVQGAGNDAFNRLTTNRNYVSGQSDAAYGRMNTDRNYVSGQNDAAYGRANTDRQYIANQGDAAYNRFNTNNTNAFNRLSAIAGTGQTGTNNVITAGQNYAQGAGTTYGNYVAGLQTNNANAQGAATIAGGNAINTGINNAVQGYQQNQFLQSILNKNTNTGSYGAPLNSFFFGNGTSGG